MDWAKDHIEALKRGETVTFEPNGKSMEPIVMDGQTVTVKPANAHTDVEIGDVVLCRVRGRSYLHKVLARDRRQYALKIGNNKGGVNGWTDPKDVYGKLVVDP